MEKDETDPLFNDPSADVTFSSSDGTLFHLKRKYLELNTGAFPGSEFDTRGEITHLTEPSAVLHVLFQFVYPQRQPDLEDLEFKTLLAVAEAAEKYEVFNAMSICKSQLRSFIPKHALDVLAHATKHDYPKLIEESANYLVRIPLEDVLEQLPPRYILPWIRYRKTWDSVFDDAFKTTLGLRISRQNSGSRITFFAGSLEPQICYSCMVAVITLIQELKEIRSVQELKEAFPKPRPALMTCISLACQYTTVASKTCADMKEQIESLRAFVPFSSTATTKRT